MTSLSSLTQKLAEQTKGKAIIHRKTASTNDDAKTLALSGAPHGTVVIALSQTKGRGRLGRVFSSKRGGLYLSFLVRNQHKADPVKLTLTAAVATARAIEGLTDLSVGIKWVNDLHIQGKKCCGILVEGVYDGVSPLPVAAVVGIGINLSNPLPKELEQIATSLQKEGAPVAHSDMAEALIKELAEGFAENAPFPIKEYRLRSVTVGKTVTVHTPSESYDAKAIGILDDGSLLVEAKGEERILCAGEVTLHSTNL